MAGQRERTDRGGGVTRMSGSGLAVNLGRLAVLLGVLAVWQLAVDRQWVEEIVLPRPGDVASVLPEVLRDAVTWQAVRTTLLEILGGAALALGAGLLIGGVAGLWSHARLFIEPSLVWLQVIPVIILYPVCVLIFGLGSESKIVFAGMYGMLPIAYATARALGYVEPGYLKTGIALGASPLKRLRFISLPSARPALVAGARIGIALVIIGVMAGQVLGSFGGLGYEITLAAQRLEAARLYGLIIVTIAVIGLLQAALTIGCAFLGGDRHRSGPRLGAKAGQSLALLRPGAGPGS